MHYPEMHVMAQELINYSYMQLCIILKCMLWQQNESVLLLQVKTRLGVELETKLGG